MKSLGWEMAIHCSGLDPWRIPWTEEPDRLQSMGSQRVGHNWATSLHFTSLLDVIRASLVAQWWRICLPMQETCVWYLAQEDLQEEDMATHSSVLAWKIPRTEDPGRLQSIGSQRVRHNWVTEHMLSNTQSIIQILQIVAILSLMTMFFLIQNLMKKKDCA